MKNLHAPTQTFVKARRADGHDHEFLRVDRIVRVRAAVEDVHHRHGQNRGGFFRGIFRNVLVERLAGGAGRGARGSHGDGENRVGAELGFVRRAVGFDHASVERALVGGIHAGDCFRDRGIHMLDRLQHAFADVAGFVAVAQLDRFMFAGRSAGRNRAAADNAAFEAHVGFDGWIAARIENLAAVNGDNLRGHDSPWHETGIIGGFRGYSGSSIMDSGRTTMTTPFSDTV